MTARKKRRRGADQTERRLEEVRGLLRQRHARVAPDPAFADRVAARLLPRDSTWSIVWAARQVLPVSLALAVALLIAVVIVRPSASQTTTQAAARTASSAATQAELDPLSWLLDSRGSSR